MKHSMPCKNCGGTISPAAKACPHCGHPNSLPVPLWILIPTAFSLAALIYYWFNPLTLVSHLIDSLGYIDGIIAAFSVFGSLGLLIVLCYFVIRAKYGSWSRMFWRRIYELQASGWRSLGSLIWELLLGALRRVFRTLAWLFWAVASPIWAVLRWPFSKKPRD